MAVVKAHHKATHGRFVYLIAEVNVNHGVAMSNLLPRVMSYRSVWNTDTEGEAHTV